MVRPSSSWHLNTSNPSNNGTGKAIWVMVGGWGIRSNTIALLTIIKELYYHLHHKLAVWDLQCNTSKLELFVCCSCLCLPPAWTGLRIKDKDRILIGIAYFLSSPRQRSKKKIDNRVFGCIWLWLLQKEYHQISFKLESWTDIHFLFLFSSSLGNYSFKKNIALQTRLEIFFFFSNCRRRKDNGSILSNTSFRISWEHNPDFYYPKPWGQN